MRRGFTLLEVMLASSLFLILVVVAFRIFEFGAWATSTTNQRHNLQSAATRTMLSLQNDLLRSALASVSLQRRTLSINGITVHRDGVAFAAMSDWNDPAGFDSTMGAASYDRYLVYYATSDTEGARLIRSLYQGPSPRTAVPRALVGFSVSTHMQDVPTSNPSSQLSYTLLAEGVREFSVWDGGSGIRASLVLFRAGARRAAEGLQKHDQSYEFEIEVVPLNTWPRD